MREVAFSEVARKLGSELRLESDRPVIGVRIDSRQILPGEIFFALPGEKTDGRYFLADAASRGALAAVVSQEILNAPLPLIVVENVLASLQHLAHQSFEENPIPVVGITGSVGKTTTKEFTATLLQEVFRVGKSPSSYNSKATFPLNLLNFSGQEQLLILEMGMSQKGEIANLIKIAAPDIAVITKIALAHAMNFPEGLEGIAQAKAEIFAEEKTKTVIVDLEALPFFMGMPKKFVTFSLTDPAADYYLFSTAGRAQIDERGVRAHELDLPFKEAHLVHDLLASIAVARTLGVSWEEIERRVPLLQLPKMRFELFERGGILFVNDAYNANPASMRAALENLPEPKEGCKRIGVLASMLELGSFSRAAHEEIGRIAARRLDALLCFGEETGPLSEEFLAAAKKPSERYSNLEELVLRLEELMCRGDVVLIKGSRSMQLEKVLGMLKKADCEVDCAPAAR